MFHTEIQTVTHTRTHAFGVAVCDRCGHPMHESDHHSGFDNLAVLRFRAGKGSRFGEGRLIEGDFCDACLFELLGRYVRVIDDARAPDTADLYQPYTPRRLYAEHQLNEVLCQELFLSMRDWLREAFDPAFTRRPLLDPPAAPTDADTPL